MGTRFMKKKVGKRETTDGDGEKVTPYLVIGFFNIERDGDWGFDICYGMCEMEGIMDGGHDLIDRVISGVVRAEHGGLGDDKGLGGGGGGRRRTVGGVGNLEPG